MQRYHFNTTMRVLGQGFRNLFRNLWLTIAATAVMLVALIIIMMGVVMNVTTSNAIEVLSKELKTAVFLEEDVSSEDRAKIETAMRDLDFVITIEYVSPEEAQRRLTENPIIGDDVAQASAIFEGSNFLSASYEVGLNDLSRAGELADLAESEEYSEIVRRVSVGKTDTGSQTDAEKAIERAAATEKFITVGSVISAATLSAVAIMIIFNTIRMAIYTRKDEISIMKLIGATPNYIRGPFLVEAALYGVFAGVAATGIVYVLVFSIGSKVSDAAEFSETYEYFTDPTTMVLMLLSSVTIGILIGVVSSMMAMEKHLKLKYW